VETDTPGKFYLASLPPAAPLTTKSALFRAGSATSGSDSTMAQLQSLTEQELYPHAVMSIKWYLNDCYSLYAYSNCKLENGIHLIISAQLKMNFVELCWSIAEIPVFGHISFTRWRSAVASARDRLSYGCGFDPRWQKIVFSLPCGPTWEIWATLDHQFSGSDWWSCGYSACT